MSAVVSEVVMWNNTANGRASTEFIIEGSYDGAGFWLVTNATLAAIDEPQVFAIDSVTSRFVRLTIQAGVSTEGRELAEFEVHGRLISDADNDGMSDGWEMQYFGSFARDGSNDDDNDQLTDLQEFTAGTRPDAADSDSDNMPDGWEVRFGLNPNLDDAATDTDRDGQSNRDEYIAGTDATNDESFFRVLFNPVLDDTDRRFIIQWDSLSNRLYSLYRITNLSLGVPEPVDTNIAPTEPLNSYTNDAGESLLFFRVGVREKD